MKIIALNRLKIENFKGCRNLDLNLGGRSMSIYGRNGVGKTTIYDAFSWLLFGRDSSGSSDFDIKPLSQDGSILDHSAITSVEASLTVEGAPLNLRRTYYERWTTRRGSADSVYDGNTSEYIVDGVPVKKFEYDRRVSELIGDDLFRTLTDVQWFCGRLDWRDRRRAIFEICGVGSDRKLMEEDPRFAPLLEAMGALTLDDVRKKLLSERKSVNGARSTIPARMDECKKTVEQLSGLDFTALRTVREEKAGQLTRLQDELLKMHHGSLLDSKRNELARARNEMAALQNENNAHRASQAIPTEDRRPIIQAAIAQARRNKEACAALSQQCIELIDAIERRIDEYRARWISENTRTFSASRCPTCGQILPPEALAAAQARFRGEVEQRKREAADGAANEKKALQAAMERQSGYARDVEAADAELERLMAEFAAYVPPEEPVVQDLPDYASCMKELRFAALNLENEVRALEQESGQAAAEKEREGKALSMELEQLDMQLGKQSTLQYALGRLKELNRDAKKAAKQLESIDRLLYLCDQFVRYKSGKVAEAVNSHFELVRWKLFEAQNNGALSDCCVATVDGVPFDSLNHGMKVNAGLDVIRTLSDYYGVSAPLFLDGAESVTSLLPVGAQVIRLVVSASDESLRCEYES